MKLPKLNTALLCLLWSCATGDFAFGDLRQPGINAIECARYLQDLVLERLGGYANLSGNRRGQEFLYTAILPLLGKRFLISESDDPRGVKVSKSSLFWGNFPDGHKNLRIEWSDSAESPSVKVTDKERTLILPKNFNAEANATLTRSLVLNWVTGHLLQPYNSHPAPGVERLRLGESALLLKPAQVEAIQAAKEATQRFENRGKLDKNFQRFLFVAPTGTGKTEVLKAVLSERLQSKERLHILTADTEHLSQQLAGDVRALNEKNQFELIEWGGEKGSESIDTLLEKIAASKKPVVLVTTIQSLKLRIRETGNPNKTYAALRKALGTFMYDEAHHAGAPEAKDLIDGLIAHKDSRAFFYGTTATPVHADEDIASLFGNRAFWAYLDTAAGYAARPGSYERPLAEVINQLDLAIQSGELTPFRDVFFMEPQALASQRGADFFIPSREIDETFAKRMYQINPVFYPDLVKALRPLIASNKKGFVTANTIEEAKTLTEVFAKAFPDRRFALLHSDMSAAEKAHFKKEKEAGRVDYIVTVRKLDEGINYPDLSLYIDLNRSVGPRQILQRMGRVLRLFPHKEHAQIFALAEVNDQHVEDMLALLEAFRDRLGNGNKDDKDRAHVEYDDEGKSKPPAGARTAADLARDYRELLAKREFWTRRQQISPLSADQLAEFQNPETGTLALLAEEARRRSIGFTSKGGAEKLMLALAEEISDPAIRKEVIRKITEDLKIAASDGLDAKKSRPAAQRIFQALHWIAEARGVEATALGSLQKAEFAKPALGITSFTKDTFDSFKGPDGALEFLKDEAKKRGFGFSGPPFGARDFMLALAEEIPDVERRAAVKKRILQIEWNKKDGESLGTALAPAARVHQALTWIAEARGADRTTIQGLDKAASVAKALGLFILTPEQHALLMDEKTGSLSLLYREAERRGFNITRGGVKQVMVELAKEIPDETRRKLALSQIEGMAWGENDISTARKSKPAADRIFQGFAYLAHAREASEKEIAQIYRKEIAEKLLGLGSRLPEITNALVDDFTHGETGGLSLLVFEASKRGLILTDPTGAQTLLKGLAEAIADEKTRGEVRKKIDDIAWVSGDLARAVRGQRAANQRLLQGLYWIAEARQVSDAQLASLPKRDTLEKVFGINDRGILVGDALKTFRDPERGTLAAFLEEVQQRGIKLTEPHSARAGVLLLANDIPSAEARKRVIAQIQGLRWGSSDYDGAKQSELAAQRIYLSLYWVAEAKGEKARLLDNLPAGETFAKIFSK